MNRTLKFRKYYTHLNYGGLYMIVTCGKNNPQFINIETGSAWTVDLHPSAFSEVLVEFNIKKVS